MPLCPSRELLALGVTARGTGDHYKTHLAPAMLPVRHQTKCPATLYIKQYTTQTPFRGCDINNAALKLP